MKKTLQSLLLISSFLLTSCFLHNNRKTDILFECNLSTEQDGVVYFLDVKKISENEFKVSNGTNVVEDVVIDSNDRYFSVNFYYFNDGQKILFDFLNLHDAYNTKRVPVRYIDDNLNALVPLSVLRLTGSPAYKVEFNRIIINFGGDLS